MAHGAQSFCETLDLSFEILLGFKIHLDLEALHLGQFFSPRHIFLLKTFAYGVTQMVAMRNTMHTIDHFGVHLHQESSLRDQLTQFMDMHRWNPDFGDQISGH